MALLTGAHLLVKGRGWAPKLRLGEKKLGHLRRNLEKKTGATGPTYFRRLWIDLFCFVVYIYIFFGSICPPVFFCGWWEKSDTVCRKTADFFVAQRLSAFDENPGGWWLGTWDIFTCHGKRYASHLWKVRWPVPHLPGVDLPWKKLCVLF